jgi:TRAP-type C4-dicarboxylate transport system substrate-binding protein
MRKLLTVLLISCSLTHTAVGLAKDQLLVKIGLSSAADAKTSGEYSWAMVFAESLRRNGMTAIIYPGSSLGNEIVRSEQIMLGLLEVNITGGQDLVDASDLYATTELPFIFRNIQEVAALIETTDFLDRVNADTGPRGLLLVDQAYLGGLTGLFTARKPIRSIEDISKFRLRAMNARQLGIFAAWGAAGTQVAWEEVPQALQTGIADGYLNAPMVPVLFGHGGQLDYFTDISMQPSMRAVVMSAKWYQGLSREQRAIVDQAAADARAALKIWVLKAIENEFSMLAGIGIERIALNTAQREAFRQSLLPIYTSIASAESIAQMEQYLAEIRGSQ